MDFKSTLCLPRTEFPMRADLARREPERLRRWEESRLYDRILKAREAAPLWVLHDGPPYANGHIHYGHILNKVLKDFAVKVRSLAGHRCAFVPGWDCHGLPVELQVDRDLGPRKATMSKVQVRQECRRYAERFVEVQRREFQRLGVLARWDRPYLTMDPSYEATIAREIGALARGGYLYRGSRPVHWCPSCRTALAEAEVEYADHVSPSIYVKFPLRGFSDRAHAWLRDRTVSFVIWTTTPWTLPANQAVALGAHVKYVAIAVGEEALVVAADLVEDLVRKCRLPASPPVVCEIDPRQVAGLRCRHPILPRDSLVVLAEFVDVTRGTGVVHIAPGHGEEDFHLGRKHGLPPEAPIDDGGRFTADVKRYKGLSTDEANPRIVEDLALASALLNRPGDTVTHSYPHCWRCKTPVLFRATPQWFANLEHAGLRQRALREIDRTRWIPPWGRDRIHGMVAERPDWCLSRQRVWGVPLPLFYCKGCGEPLVDGDVIDHVAALFAERGADVWFEREAAALVPEGTRCGKCGGAALAREQDIVDVWFESGVSWAAVCEGRPDLWPIDLYLEGSDQHRGWFHSSLLAAVATRERAPYHAVLTHGFVVDEATGEPYSKSARNFIPTDEIVGKHGAEILRVWVAYVDYRKDMPFGPGLLVQLGESYRRMRNTFRFLLGNLHGFSPDGDALPIEALRPLDRWALSRLRRLCDRVRAAYLDYEFSTAFRALGEYCATDLSGLYLDVIKDRLYCEAEDSDRRRSAQTALYAIARALAIHAAPILCFTADELWEHLARRAGDPDSVHLALFPDDLPPPDELVEGQYQKLLSLRERAMGPLEEFRAKKHPSLAAHVVFELPPSVTHVNESELCDLLIVSKVTGRPVEGLDEVRVRVEPAAGEKCPRCWKVGPASGDARDPQLCARCARVLSEIES